jgi:hypothetical protein
MNSIGLRSVMAHGSWEIMSVKVSYKQKLAVQFVTAVQKLDFLFLRVRGEVLVAVSYRQLLLYGMLVPRIASTNQS